MPILVQIFPGVKLKDEDKERMQILGKYPMKLGVREKHKTSAVSLVILKCAALSCFSLSQCTSGLLAGLQECFMGLINSANSVFKWNGTWGEAIRAACIGSTFSSPSECIYTPRSDILKDS